MANIASQADITRLKAWYLLDLYNDFVKRHSYVKEAKVSYQKITLRLSSTPDKIFVAEDFCGFLLGDPGFENAVKSRSSWIDTKAQNPGDTYYDLAIALAKYIIDMEWDQIKR